MNTLRDRPAFARRHLRHVALAMAHGRICIGTSGWNYRHWKGVFYPERVPPSDWLAHYASHLTSVEINNSFYQLPDEGTLASWRETVSDDFVFAAKASRYVTHMKKLKDPDAAAREFLERISVLGDRLGPLLFQLPPKWRFDPDRLDSFLASMPDDQRLVVEPRDRTWFDERAYEILEDHRAALCIYDLSGFQSPRRVTTDFVYVRLHGPREAYRGSYDDGALRGWAGAISAWTRTGRDVYVYFDNDEAGHAVHDALTLRDMLS